VVFLAVARSQASQASQAPQGDRLRGWHLNPVASTVEEVEACVEEMWAEMRKAMVVEVDMVKALLKDHDRAIDWRYVEGLMWASHGSRLAKIGDMIIAQGEGHSQSLVVAQEERLMAVADACVTSVAHLRQLCVFASLVRAGDDGAASTQQAGATSDENADSEHASLRTQLDAVQEKLDAALREWDKVISRREILRVEVSAMWVANIEKEDVFDGWWPQGRDMELQGTFKRLYCHPGVLSKELPSPVLAERVASGAKTSAAGVGDAGTSSAPPVADIINMYAFIYSHYALQRVLSPLVLDIKSLVRRVKASLAVTGKALNSPVVSATDMAQLAQCTYYRRVALDALFARSPMTLAWQYNVMDRRQVVTASPLADVDSDAPSAPFDTATLVPGDVHQFDSSSSGFAQLPPVPAVEALFKLVHTWATSLTATVSQVLESRSLDLCSMALGPEAAQEVQRVMCHIMSTLQRYTQDESNTRRVAFGVRTVPQVCGEVYEPTVVGAMLKMVNAVHQDICQQSSTLVGLRRAYTDLSIVQDELVPLLVFLEGARRTADKRSAHVCVVAGSSMAMDVVTAAIVSRSWQRRVMDTIGSLVDGWSPAAVASVATSAAHGIVTGLPRLAPWESMGMWGLECQWDCLEMGNDITSAPSVTPAPSTRASAKTESAAVDGGADTAGTAGPSVGAKGGTSTSHAVPETSADTARAAVTKAITAASQRRATRANTPVAADGGGGEPTRTATTDTVGNKPSDSDDVASRGVPVLSTAASAVENLVSVMATALQAVSSHTTATQQHPPTQESPASLGRRMVAGELGLIQGTAAVTGTGVEATVATPSSLPPLTTSAAAATPTPSTGLDMSSLTGTTTVSSSSPSSSAAITATTSGVVVPSSSGSTRKPFDSQGTRGCVPSPA